MNRRSLLLAVGFPALLAAQSVTVPPRPLARALRVDRGPELNGRLDDSLWSRAPVVAGFVQHEPSDQGAPSERTEVRILYDGEALYIGARLYDSDPAGIVRGEVRRDTDLKEQDSFLIVLDTYHDRQNGFVFGTTPAGIEHDAQVTREGEPGFGIPSSGNPNSSLASANLNWDGTWTVATSVDSAGWTAVFRIPFETLRYGGGKSQTWGLNFARYLRRKNEEDYWAAVPRQFNIYRVSLAGDLAAVEPPRRRLVRATPSAVGTLQRDFLAGTPTDAALQLGLDAKLGITQSLTADLTYNTDFAQVEADDQQINLTRFNLFFPEKRPFFLENAGTFAVGTPESVELFSSRRIGIGSGGQSVPLLGGGRLTGKVGGLTVGLLDIQTRRVTTAGLTAVPPNNFSVGRVLKELPHRSRVGAIAVSRFNSDSTGDHSLTVGADARIGIGDAVSIDGYVAHSESPARSGASNAFSVSGGYVTRTWEFGAALRQADPDFNPEVGFLERPTFRYTNFRILRHLRTPGIRWFREARPHVTFREYDDTDGHVQSRLLHFDSHFAFSNGAFFEAPGNFVREVLREPFTIAPGVVLPVGTYDWVEWAPIFYTNLSAPYAISGRATIGGFYTGHHAGGQVSFIARPSEKFNTTVRVNYDRVRLREGNFTRVLVGLRLAYAFTPRVFLQSLIQHNNQGHNLSANIRFGWLGPAGTGLFVVFNEGWETGDNARNLNRAIIVKFTRQLDLGS